MLEDYAKQPNSVADGTPDAEVSAKAKRRRFSAAYKLEVLEKADGCNDEGEMGKLLREEGLYSSHLSNWRRQRRDGALKALSKKRGRKARLVDQEKLRLERENKRLRQKLAQAELIIEIQKKTASLLGIPLATTENDGSE